MFPGFEGNGIYTREEVQDLLSEPLYQFNWSVIPLNSLLKPTWAHWELRLHMYHLLQMIKYRLYSGGIAIQFKSPKTTLLKQKFDKKYFDGLKPTLMVLGQFFP